MMDARVYVDTALPSDSVELACLDASITTHPWSERQFMEELAAEGPRRVLVVRDLHDDVLGIVAFLVLHVVADEACVRNLGVGLPFHRQGLARLLLRLARRLARHRGASEIHLEVRESNGAARGLYAAEGFLECGRRRRYYVSPPEDAVLLCQGLCQGSSR